MKSGKGSMDILYNKTGVKNIILKYPEQKLKMTVLEK